MTDNWVKICVSFEGQLSKRLGFLPITEGLCGVGWHEVNRLNVHVPDVKYHFISWRDSEQIVRDGAPEGSAFEVNG